MTVDILQSIAIVALSIGMVFQSLTINTMRSEQ